MTRRLIALFRSACFVFHLLAGLCIALIYPQLALKTRRHILQAWSTILLCIFNVRIDIDKDDLLHKFRHGLIVSNHISWLDVFVLNSVLPMRFVAKSDLRHWPVFGWLSVRVQTLFIERGKVRSAARINVEMVELLKRGESLAIFPEGTTTNGEQVAHFHSSLFQPAIDAGVQVFPVTIRYQDASGSHNIAPAYIDDMSFIASLWNILNTHSLHVRLTTSAAIDTLSGNRRELTRMAQQSISIALNTLHRTTLKMPLLDTNISRERSETELHFQSLYYVLLNPPSDQSSVRHPPK